MMLSRTLQFYWLRKVSHRNWKRLQREKRDWAGASYCSSERVDDGTGSRRRRRR